jgi:hypothetical protein
MPALKDGDFYVWGMNMILTLGVVSVFLPF